MSRVVPLLAALLSLAALDLPAQRLDAWPRFAPAAGFDHTPDRVRVGDYRVAGLAVGAGVIGLVGVALASSLCGGSNPPGTTCSSNDGTSFLIGAGIGAALGYVVGRAIPKYAPEN